MFAKAVELKSVIFFQRKFFMNVFYRYDVAEHTNCMTTRVIILWSEHVTSMITSASTMRFLVKIIILKAIKSRFVGPYNKQNLTLVHKKK